MIDIGAIQPSNSPWASAIVLVRKKWKTSFLSWSEEIEFSDCKDAYSIPRIQDTLGCPQGVVWFILLDVKSRYWQVELEEASEALMAFTVGTLRFYKGEWMPFGLTNTVATFQCLIETTLGNLQFWWCIIYLDDIIIFAATPEKHLERLCIVLLQPQAAGLKLQPTKCEFFKVNVVYLEHKISKEGIWTDGCKLKATIGLGVILYQEQDGKDRVITYASRALSKSKSHYPAHNLRSLVLKWAVTESFQEYLYGNT